MVTLDAKWRQPSREIIRILPLDKLAGVEIGSTEAELLADHENLGCLTFWAHVRPRDRRHGEAYRRGGMDRNYLKGRLGDRINAVLAAAGYNFGLLLRWLAKLLRVIIRAFIETVPAQNIA